MQPFTTVGTPLLAADAPWMPPEPFMEIWANVGRVAGTCEVLRATSIAFAAIASEQEALRQVMHLAQSPRREALSWFLEIQPIVTTLYTSTEQWAEVAQLLACIINTTVSGWLETLPADLDMDTLIGLALDQQARLWTIAQRLLDEQVLPYRPLLNQVLPLAVAQQSSRQHPFRKDGYNE